MKAPRAVETDEPAMPWRSHADEERVLAALRSAGQRPTGARICTLQVLLGSHEALNAQAVYRQLLQAGVELHLSSIYRALSDMEKSRLVVRDWEDFIGGKKAAYRISPERGGSLDGTPRCDVRCRGCGHDFSSVDHGLAEQLTRLAQAHGLRLSDNPVTIELTCGACAQSTPPAPPPPL